MIKRTALTPEVLTQEKQEQEFEHEEDEFVMGNGPAVTTAILALFLAISCAVLWFALAPVR